MAELTQSQKDLAKQIYEESVTQWLNGLSESEKQKAMNYKKGGRRVAYDDQPNYTGIKYQDALNEVGLEVSVPSNRAAEIGNDWLTDFDTIFKIEQEISRDKERDAEKARKAKMMQAYDVSSSTYKGYDTRRKSFGKSTGGILPEGLSYNQGKTLLGV